MFRDDFNCTGAGTGQALGNRRHLSTVTLARNPCTRLHFGRKLNRSMARREFWFHAVNLAILCAITLLFPVVSFAQQPPGDGSSLLVCTFYGESNQGGSAWNRQQSCQLPPDFPLDDLYKQQTAFLAGGGAGSNMNVGQIPPGIHIDVSGGHYWSVNSPIGLSQPGPDGRRTFTIETYCGPAGAPGPGCNVKVNVFARKRQTWAPDQQFFGWSSIYARNKGSTVLIRVESEGNTPNYGSGVIVGAGKVLTAKHLLPPTQAIRNKRYLITGLVDWERNSLDFSTASELSIDYVSKKADFAVLSFANKPPDTSPVFFETPIQAPEPLMVLAYPSGSRLSPLTGIGSGDAADGKFAINASLGRGTSGGPVFSPGGGLVGIVVQGPTSSDPGKLAFFLRSSAILAELPTSSGMAVWPDLPKVRSDPHIDTLSLTGSPSTPDSLDFSYPVEEVAAQKQGAPCCELLFQSQRGMTITRARFIASSTGSLSMSPQIIISATGDRATIRLPVTAGTSHGKFLGYLWTHQIASSH